MDRQLRVQEQSARQWGQAKGAAETHALSAVRRFLDADDFMQKVASGGASRLQEYSPSRQLFNWALRPTKSNIIDECRGKGRSWSALSEAIPPQHALLIGHRMTTAVALNVCSDWSRRLIFNQLRLLQRPLSRHRLTARPADLFDGTFPRIRGEGETRTTTGSSFNYLIPIRLARAL